MKRLPGGHGVSYAHQYVTKRETTVGLVPLGYADGIPRAASGTGPVFAGGRNRVVAGRVCMDQFVLDLGDDPAREGDEVILFGAGGGAAARDRQRQDRADRHRERARHRQEQPEPEAGGRR